MILLAAAFRRSPSIFRIFPIQCRHMAQDLDQLRVETVADLPDHFPPGLTVLGVDPYLDEFMGLEGAVDFRQHRLGEAELAGDHHGFQVMGAGFEMTFLFLVHGKRRSVGGAQYSGSERPGVMAV